MNPLKQVFLPFKMRASIREFQSFIDRLHLTKDIPLFDLNIERNF